jgi:hypothetical protein
MQNAAPTIYAYPDIDELIRGESAGGNKRALVEGVSKPVTERPDSH